MFSACKGEVAENKLATRDLADGQVLRLDSWVVAY